MPTLTAAPTNSTGTGAGWANPNNVFASDDARAQDDIGVGATTDDLITGGYDFSALPTNITIDGLEILVEGSCAVGTQQFNVTSGASAQLFLGGAYRSATTIDATVWSATADVTKIMGSATDKFGVTPTRADLVDAAFKARLAFTEATEAAGAGVRMDQIQVRVNYTATSPRQRAGWEIPSRLM